MATVKKGNLIVNCLPSTVCDENQTRRQQYSMEFICTTGGVQAFANDARHFDSARISRNKGDIHRKSKLTNANYGLYTCQIEVL
jgi:hypothetical protein